MSYSEPLINQVYRFFLAVGFGVLMGIFYEAVNLLKTVLFPGFRAAVVLDFLFSVVYTVLSFFFMLIYNEGEVRANLALAQLIGVYVFHKVFGKKITEPFDLLKRKIKDKKQKNIIKRNKN